MGKENAMRLNALMLSFALVAAASPAEAVTLPACESKQAAELARQAVYDDWILLGLEKTAKSIGPYFDKLRDGTDDESRALKRAMMRVARRTESQIRICRAKPMADSPQSAPVVVIMVSPITGGMGGFVVRYGAGNRTAYFGDPVE
jgi:hypothetical protein